MGAALSDLADAAARAALDVALGEAGEGVRFAVIAMGKWGARELNYASDIDVLFVYDGSGASAETQARRVAETFVEVLAGHGPGGVVLRVDADLRPEGRSGPLARSLASYRAYWERWADAWELQALIKARPAAGDPDLGRAFVAAAEPHVYPETLGAEAVHEVRSMKARAEALAERSGGSVEVKRGVGGIRDAEFAVQLLQLVHGRSDPEIRAPATLDALEALGRHGYVHPDDAASLGDAYRWLRDVEHRLQLVDLRRTHELPAAPPARERIAKAMGYRDAPEAAALARFEGDLVARRAAIRTIHERLFYRPLLEVFAAAPAGRLTEDEAARRLAALGFLDADAARRAFEDLTAGLSRRSRLMRQMLPLMLDWLSGAPDPDLGLSQLRLLVGGAADNAALVAALRDNPVAGERLCTLLGTSRLLGRMLDRIPPFLATLGDDAALAARPGPGELAAEAARRVALRAGNDPGAALHRLHAERLLRIAGADLTGAADAEAVGRRLTETGDALVAAALEAAAAAARERGDDPPPVALVALGKWGGSELNYASDLDALLVHDPAGREPAAAAAGAERLASDLIRMLDPSGADGPAFTVDFDLRPEGRSGPLSRSVASYRAYWERWAATWECQALLRARPAAGDPDLGAALLAAAEPFVYRRDEVGSRAREIRSMKARIERERVSPPEDPEFHMKLGRGGLADVEWTVQLLQMQHGGDDPALRTPGTLPGLSALRRAGLLESRDADELEAAYRLCARVRNRLYLQAGRRRDSLPTDPAEVTRLARSLGYGRGPRSSLREDYRRVTRRARRVVERVFYGLERSR